MNKKTIVILGVLASILLLVAWAFTGPSSRAAHTFIPDEITEGTRLVILTHRGLENMAGEPEWIEVRKVEDPWVKVQGFTRVPAGEDGKRRPGEGQEEPYWLNLGGVAALRIIE